MRADQYLWIHFAFCINSITNFQTIKSYVPTSVQAYHVAQTLLTGKCYFVMLSRVRRNENNEIYAWADIYVSRDTQAQAKAYMRLTKDDREPLFYFE